MTRIINRTNSPFDLQGVHGSIRLPANGEVEAEFSPDYLDILRAGGNVEVEESAPKPKRGRPRKQEATDGD